MRLNKAFTLAEMLIVFIVIGIIASVGVSTVKPWEKSAKFAYSRVYNAISLALYNYASKATGTQSFPSTSTNLCCALLEYINTSGDTVNESGTRQDPCTKNENGNFNTPPTGHTCNLTSVGKEPTSSTLLVHPANRTTSPTNTYIVLSNGITLWIGADTGGAPFTSATGRQDTNGNDIRFRYYMVFADINGTKKPNTSNWNSNKLADIVGFAVTDKFVVLPLGYPTVDTRYLSAHYVIPSEIDEGEIVSDEMTLYEAKVKAFGYNRNNQYLSNADDLFSLDYEDIMGLNYKSNGGHFRLQNLDQYYNTNPTTDNQCRESYIAADGTRQYSPICEIRIYDYH